MKEFRIVWKSLAGQEDQVVAKTQDLKKAVEFFDMLKEMMPSMVTNIQHYCRVNEFNRMVALGKAKTVYLAQMLTLVMVIDDNETELDAEDRIYYEQYDEDE